MAETMDQYRDGKIVFDVMRSVRDGWLPRDTLEAAPEDWTRIERFLTGHYHLGNWSSSRDMAIAERCLLCFEAFSREHFIWYCERLEMVRRVTLGRLLDRDGWNIARLIWLGSAPFGCFPRGAHELFGRSCVFVDFGAG